MLTRKNRLKRRLFASDVTTVSETPTGRDRRSMRSMLHQTLRAISLPAVFLVFSGCAAPPAPETGPPPLQNMLGSTDELQLITELSIDLASSYGGEQLLVVLEIENTLVGNSLTPGGKFPSGSLQPFQEDSATQVRRMQESGLKVIAMSSAEPGQQQRLSHELSRNDFSFQASAWPPAEGYPDSFTPTGAARPVTYRDGIFLLSGQDSGQMLKALFDKAGESQPKLILILDHDQNDLNEVMQAFSWSGTKIHAWRYTREAAGASATGH